jgi:DNA invertase Pin-like site-specific DNA recombinase
MKPTGVGARLIRVSGERQDTERQIKDCERWEREQGVIPTYIFEDKESRFLAERREGFQRLMEHVRAHRVNWVVIQTIDRLGFKQSYELFEFIGEFMKHGVRLFTSLDGACVTSTDDYTVIKNAIAGQTSTKELLEKSNRTQGKRILKGKAGEYQGGMPPYGFDVICKDASGKPIWRFVQMGRKKGLWHKDGRQIEVNELPRHDWLGRRETVWLSPSIVRERRETLIRIFEIFDSEATSTLQIARTLNQEGISPVLSSKWAHSKVWALLQNPAAIGRPASNKVTSAKINMVLGEKQVPRNQDEIGRFLRHAKDNWLMPEQPIFDALIPEEMFWRCALKLHSQSGNRAPKNENLLLSGLLYCGKCGKTMAGQYKAKMSRGKRVPGFYSYYRCQVYMNEKTNNEYGCRNHGTLQETVMPHVHEFLESRGQILEQFVTNRNDTRTLTSLIREHRASSEQVTSIVAAMQIFVHDALSGTEVDFEYFTDDELEENKHTIVDMYEQIYDVQRKELEGRLRSLESEHTNITTQYFKLPPKAQEKAVSTLKDLEGRIAVVKTELEPLAERWEGLLISLVTLRDRIQEASRALKHGNLRQQAAALRKAIAKIEVHYVPKGAKYSRLVLVRIVPVIGEPQDYRSSEGINGASATPCTSRPASSSTMTSRACMKTTRSGWKALRHSMHLHSGTGTTAPVKTTPTPT